MSQYDHGWLRAESALRQMPEGFNLYDWMLDHNNAPEPNEDHQFCHGYWVRVAMSDPTVSAAAKLITIWKARRKNRNQLTDADIRKEIRRRWRVLSEAQVAAVMAMSR